MLDYYAQMYLWQIPAWTNIIGKYYHWQWLNFVLLSEIFWGSGIYELTISFECTKLEYLEIYKEVF